MATLGKALPQTQTTVLPVRLRAGKTTALKFRDEILLALDTLRKNSLRSAAPKRRALARSAPFCQDGFATGGSGGMS